MASDDAYSAFLDKANQDTGVSSASTKSSSSPFKTVNTEIPSILEGVEQYYISDADEPFEVVSLKWSGGNMPSEQEFASLINHKGSVSTLSTKDFDPKGQYGDVLEAVGKAGNGKARVFRVEEGGSRVQYWVVALDKSEGKVVGMRARAVES